MRLTGELVASAENRKSGWKSRQSSAISLNCCNISTDNCSLMKRALQFAVEKVVCYSLATGMRPQTCIFAQPINGSRVYIYMYSIYILNINTHICVFACKYIQYYLTPFNVPLTSECESPNCLDNLFTPSGGLQTDSGNCVCVCASRV